ncbi:Uma2 family endonuclease [Crocosphaera sp. XPORK-15E]|uniref:Uma2 family endonuclease n=1 Tax=Crocosphaera sp. XPORK-15E TaxID=3110247 RepID=UPI002B1EC5B4|nr:Uma2 family endonuclease [Crocosphaera sp. XPORK-15E]MEA5535625.1 Uma2 family endonuclease [Crocosphaera sp. XPORK-15E]
MITVSRKQFTLEEYNRLTELGFFESGERVELIRGDIITMAAKRTFHSVCNSLLLEELYILLRGKANIRGQEPIIIHPNSQPEPDVVIARKKEDNYLSSHPQVEDILLIIEIADSTLRFDREVKLSLYAEAGINDFWLFNLIDNQLETYNQPYQASNRKYNYRSQQIYLPNDIISIPHFSDIVLALEKFFF